MHYIKIDSLDEDADTKKGHDHKDGGDDQENGKQHFSDRGGALRDAGKSEQTGDDRHHECNECPL